VKVTTYLSRRRFGNAKGTIRRDILGAHAPAPTVVIAGIYGEKWLLEIDATAAA
jgi:2-iminobutanoate/2-iminopropanoate deaminase